MRKNCIKQEIVKAQRKEKKVFEENENIQFLGIEIFNTLGNKSLAKHIGVEELLVFDLKYNSKDKVPKGNMYDFRHRANQNFMWTIGLYESVRDNEYPENYDEFGQSKVLSELYGHSFFARKNLVLRSQEGFFASCADGNGLQTRYVTKEGAKSLDYYTFPLVRELALGENEFGEEIKLSVPFGGTRWIDYDNNIRNDNWIDFKGPITPAIFKDIITYITKGKVKL